MAAEKPTPLEERRAGFARYKKDVKERGKPFYPYAMFHDTVMSLIVVCVIVGARRHLEVDVVRPAPQRPRQGSARPRVRAAGRPRHGQLRAAARLVLLLPLLPPAHLQVAGVGVPRDDRRPDDRAHPPARAAVHGPAPRAAPVAAAGRDGRGGADDPLDGRPHVEGRDREGGARLRGDRGRAVVGEGGGAAAGGDPGREALRDGGLYGVSHVSRDGLVEPRRAGPDRHRHAQPRHQLPDPSPAVPVVREPGLADAEVRLARRHAPAPARRLPRSFQGQEALASAAHSLGDSSACRRARSPYGSHVGVRRSRSRGRWWLRHPRPLPPSTLRVGSGQGLATCSKPPGASANPSWPCA